MGPDVLKMVTESHRLGRVSRDLNSTFIALIPKMSKPSKFDDFRPISLCNLIYKIISKVIDERLKPFLASSITGEQFGFLLGRQILDVVRITQEGIHSIRTRKLSSVLLKIDLIKAYDRVDWVFLRLLLIHVGMESELVNWIVACVNCVHISILINGLPTKLFLSQRGLR